MADTINKRYYWLKLPEQFFNQKEIKTLRKIAGGDTFTIIYLKMLLRSLSEDGRLYYEGYESDFASELALDIDEDVENVKITVQYLMANNILYQTTATEYEVMTVHEMTGSETASTRRSRKFRQKALQCNTDATFCNADATKCNGESDKESDKELEKESEKSQESDTEQEKSQESEGTIDNDNDCWKEKYGISVEAMATFVRKRGVDVTPQEVRGLFRQGFPPIVIAWMAEAAKVNATKNPKAYFITTAKAKAEAKAFSEVALIASEATTPAERWGVERTLGRLHLSLKMAAQPVA